MKKIVLIPALIMLLSIANVHTQKLVKCQNCKKDDPIEQTTQVVLQTIPQVLNSFIKIVQNPHNSENVAQNITAIVAHIANIATSSSKRNEQEQEVLKQALTEALSEIIVAYVQEINDLHELET